ncbi:hypothetical protein ACLOJK_021274 [Asimina triloba]
MQVVASSWRVFQSSKALLDYERHKVRCGELNVHVASPIDSMTAETQVVRSQALGPVRVRRDAAARAMQEWHSRGLIGNGYVVDSLIKMSTLVVMTEFGYIFSRVDAVVADIGPAADWVKINVRRTRSLNIAIHLFMQNDCFEIYALVPGLLREEVRVQSDPAGRLVISGEPGQPDNPWGVTPFKKIVSLPSRIDPHQTTAVVTLHGQLFVRAPFEQPVV